MMNLNLSFMNNVDQYISFFIDGHDSNISFYRPSDNKLLSLELERVWGQRYFRYNLLSKQEKQYFFKYIKSIVKDFGFDPVFKVGLFVIPSFNSNEICLDWNMVQEEFGIIDVHRYDHHDCHAASAFYDSQYDYAFIASYDGGGNDGMFCTYEANKVTGLKKLKQHDFLDFTTSYSITSVFIKEISKSNDRMLNVLTGAGKVMGLSAYGSYNKDLYDKSYTYLTTRNFPNYANFYKIIGIALMCTYKVISGNKGWIEDVVVDSASRGKGIGRKLINLLVEVGEEKELSEILLFTEDHRVAAINLYSSVGFKLKDSKIYCKKK